MKSAWILLSTLCFAQSAPPVAVGTCRPHLTSYSTISAAVAAVPSGATVLVCPGIYPERVMIEQSLTLKGLATTNNSVMVESITAQDPAVEGTGIGVDISDVVVYGTGGIVYITASGSLGNISVAGGIEVASGSQVGGAVAYIHNSFIVGAVSAGGTGSGLSLVSNQIVGGVSFGEFSEGIVEHNTILVPSDGYGIYLDGYYSTRVTDNTIIGGKVGIALSDGFPMTITHNYLYNNAVGIQNTYSATNNIINSNTIVQSGTAGIDLACGVQKAVTKNTIKGAPIGIASVPEGENVSRNTFVDVSDLITACPTK